MRKVKKISLLVLMFSLVLLAACDKKCTPSSNWSFDDSKHWHECVDCEENLNVDVHKLTWSVKTAATCEVGLVEKGVCVCGYTTTRQGPKLEHKAEDLLGSAPTCEESGLTEGKKCSVCDEIIVEQKEIAALGHIEAILSGKAPTCEEPGLTEGKKCSVCDEIIVEQKEIPMLEHIHSLPVKENEVESTCSTEGHYDSVVYCSICDEEISREKVRLDLLTHTEVILSGKAPTCEEPGLTEGKKCSVCDEILVEQKEFPMLEHIHSLPIIENEVESTCSTEGHYDSVVYCSICNEEISREKVMLELLPHTETIIDKLEATCTESGLTEGKKCSVCDEILVAQEEIPALGHTKAFGVSENIITSTCDEEGHFDWVTYCSICHEELSRKIMMFELRPHTEVILPSESPTCQETGLTEGKKCVLCDKILVEQKEIPMLEHTHSEAVIENEVESTCSTEGHYDSVVYCSICNEEISREKVMLELLPHTETIIDKVEATCTESGLTEGKKCSVCDEILVAQEEIPAVGHTKAYGVSENIINSTCDEEGHYDWVTYCSICHEELSRTIMMFKLRPHTEVVLSGKAPTCEEPGLTEGKKCILCDKILVEQEEIPASGHSLNDGKCENCEYTVVVYKLSKDGKSYIVMI